MNYEINFLKNHPWLGRGFSKLNKKEIEILENFLSEDFESRDEAMQACNRLFMDKEKTKNFTTVIEMASSAITHRFA